MGYWKNNQTSKNKLCVGMKRLLLNSVFSRRIIITRTNLHQSCLLHDQVAAQFLPDIYATNHLINVYAKSGQLGIAHQLFDQMPHKNIVSWTALISGYAQQRKPEHCFYLFTKMLSHYSPNDFTYASVLSSCDYSRGVQVHAHALKTGFDCWVYVANALIAMYWKNCCNGGGIEAWNVFDDVLDFRNLVTYNSMINGLGMYAQVDMAMALFVSMCRNGVGFDRTTIVTLLSSLCKRNDGIEMDVVLTCCLQLHCVSVKTSLTEDVGMVTALIKAYSNLGVNSADLYKLFLDMRSAHQDVVLWTTIMGVFSEREPEQVISLFNRMRSGNLYPDYYVFSVLLKACASLVTERHALAVHSQVIVVGFANVLAIENALIHAYSKCGSLQKAKQVFDEMEAVRRDIITWNSILKAYAMHGKAEIVFNLFEKMTVQPDGTTFVALLSSCSHAGMVKEGMKIFDTMFERYGIVPQLDHYACIVDVLGRAGHLSEAVNIITKMPMETDYVIWSALLGSCRKYGDVRLVNLAFSKVRELNPSNSLGYVMTSNIYCSAENFDEGGVVWKDMRQMGVKKEPGLSWTEIGHIVHEFASGGQRHPEIGSIRANLELMLGKLKKIGYVPETSLVLYDIEEEHKEEQLYLHSEKLALVFSLMNSGRNNRNGGVIKIIKNIRICLDCHNFMRLASELVEKDIVVRDANRFHHFKKGACSCNDYW